MVSENSAMPAQDFTNLEIPKVIKQPVKRTNTANLNLSRGTPRQKSGSKICSHKQTSRPKPKRHMRHVSENIQVSNN